MSTKKSTNNSKNTLSVMIVVAVMALGAGAYAGYSFSQLRALDLQPQINELERTISQLNQTNSELREEIARTRVDHVILSAPTNTVYYVPTGNIYDDSTFYAFYSTAENSQIITSPTQSAMSSAYLDDDGGPLFTGHIVTFGGRSANRLVKYYEEAGIATVGFAKNGTHLIFKRVSDDEHLYSVEGATYNKTEKDYFVYQIYRDGDRHVLSVWGFNAEGTYAAGLCFINEIYPNLENSTNPFYIYSWTDLNNDGMPQTDEIVLETTGN